MEENRKPFITRFFEEFMRHIHELIVSDDYTSAIYTVHNGKLQLMLEYWDSPNLTRKSTSITYAEISSENSKYINVWEINDLSSSDIIPYLSANTVP